MKTKKLLPYLILLLTTAFISGCPVDEDDLFGGTVTITNSSGDTMDEIAIDENCVGGWDGIGTISLATGATGSYDVSASIASDDYDVRVCNVGGNSCFIWFFVGPGDDTLDTATSTSSTRQTGC